MRHVAPFGHRSVQAEAAFTLRWIQSHDPGLDTRIAQSRHSKDCLSGRLQPLFGKYYTHRNSAPRPLQTKRFIGEPGLPYPHNSALSTRGSREMRQYSPRKLQVITSMQLQSKFQNSKQLLRWGCPCSTQSSRNSQATPNSRIHEFFKSKSIALKCTEFTCPASQSIGEASILQYWQV